MTSALRADVFFALNFYGRLFAKAKTKLSAATAFAYDQTPLAFSKSSKKISEQQQDAIVR
ncbi:hypothetical protein [Treponema pectinovorum]|uniref:hypothetical protein n=1 Tax=Treponema pectinovorum TaxID=164 RepID=UPI0011F1F666|nr:hypothetical protein [Treponema pectinovorum]